MARWQGGAATGLLALGLVVACSNVEHATPEGGAPDAAASSDAIATDAWGDTGVESGAPVDASAPDAVLDAPLESDATLQPVDFDGGGCPLGMVEVPVPAGTAYCVDATEVTSSAYIVFLATQPSLSNQPPECAGNTTYAPEPFGADGGPVAPPPGDLPVTFVDWCDARAYCAALGKRLCGRIGGGATPYYSLADAKLSQWYAACSAGGALPYPYGSSYKSGACNGYSMKVGAPIGVGLATACEGGYSGLFDMSGNVFEWEDACESATASAQCRIRGGSFNDESLQCDAPAAVERMIHSGNIGFRCCGP